jgi:hypothetical protein
MGCGSGQQQVYTYQEALNLISPHITEGGGDVTLGTTSTAKFSGLAGASIFYATGQV